MNNWHAYVAGFFDGEGSVTICRQKAGLYNDYHKIVVTITQRAEHRPLLEAIQREFGGRIVVKHQSARISGNWAQVAVWQLQDRKAIAQFLETIGPMLIVKATPAWIAREFLASVTPKSKAKRSFEDRTLASEELALRDGFMLAIQEANHKGRPRSRTTETLNIGIV